VKALEQNQDVEDQSLNEGSLNEGDDGQNDADEESNTEEAEIILQKAKQEASGRKFLKKFLGKPNPNKSSPSSRQINCTDVVYRIGNSDMTDTYEKGGLVDRGANGGLAGKDLKVIATTDRRVDITGINDIKVDNIRIGTVGGVVKSHRGPIIAIFHQYALGDHGNSIHSSGQMESYRNKIDDRSTKVGGTQSITTIDGYDLPLDVVNGLPHLKSRPFSEREWKEYPHVVMTSDNEWNPKVLDNIISTKPNWYSSVRPPEHDVLTNPFDITGEYTKSQLEDPLVYSHLDISWGICSAQLRNLHKED
jgi:hypothetical protein